MRRYRVLDVESCDLAPPAELVEVATTDLLLNADRTTEIVPGWSKLFLPTTPIPPVARAVHHLGAKQLAGCSPCTTEDLVDFATREAPTVLVAHNSAMEAQWFTPEVTGGLPWLCTMKAAYRVFPEAPGFSLGVLRYWLEDEGLIPDLGDAAQPAHRAGPDTLVTAYLLSVLLQKATTQDMLAWTQQHALLPTCPIGEHRGKKWAEVDHGFLTWILKKPDMGADIKWNAEQEIIRRRQMQR